MGRRRPGGETPTIMSRAFGYLRCAQSNVVYQLETKTIVVGRSEGACDIVLPHASVSGRHFELHFFKDSSTGLLACEGRDLLSKNRTFVNGKAVGRGNIPVRIHSGDELRFGYHTSAYRLEFDVSPHDICSDGRRYYAAASIASDGSVQRSAEVQPLWQSIQRRSDAAGHERAVRQGMMHQESRAVESDSAGLTHHNGVHVVDYAAGQEGRGQEGAAGYQQNPAPPPHQVVTGQNGEAYGEQPAGGTSCTVRVSAERPPAGIASIPGQGPPHVSHDDYGEDVSSLRQGAALEEWEAPAGAPAKRALPHVTSSWDGPGYRSSESPFPPKRPVVYRSLDERPAAGVTMAYHPVGGGAQAVVRDGYPMARVAHHGVGQPHHPGVQGHDVVPPCHVVQHNPSYVRDPGHVDQVCVEARGPQHAQHAPMPQYAHGTQQPPQAQQREDEWRPHVRGHPDDIVHGAPPPVHGSHYPEGEVPYKHDLPGSCTDGPSNTSQTQTEDASAYERRQMQESGVGTLVHGARSSQDTSSVVTDGTSEIVTTMMKEFGKMKSSVLEMNMRVAEQMRLQERRMHEGIALQRAQTVTLSDQVDDVMNAVEGRLEGIQSEVERTRQDMTDKIRRAVKEQSSVTAAELAATNQRRARVKDGVAAVAMFVDVDGTVRNKARVTHGGKTVSVPASATEQADGTSVDVVDKPQYDVDGHDPSEVEDESMAAHEDTEVTMAVDPGSMYAPQDGKSGYEVMEGDGNESDERVLGSHLSHDGDGDSAAMLFDPNACGYEWMNSPEDSGDGPEAEQDHTMQSAQGQDAPKWKPPVDDDCMLGSDDGLAEASSQVDDAPSSQLADQSLTHVMDDASGMGVSISGEESGTSKDHDTHANGGHLSPAEVIAALTDGIALNAGVGEPSTGVASDGLQWRWRYWR